MTPQQRVEITLQGGRADVVPIFPIYDLGYVMASIGRNARDFIVASGKERVDYIEQSFRRHKVDGIFVHAGTNDDWINHHVIDKYTDHWMVTDQRTGERRRLLPDGRWTREDGTPIPWSASGAGESTIRTVKDLETQVPQPPSEADIEPSGRFWPLRHLAETYPDHHYSFQIISPFSRAVDNCGGYEKGLTTLVTDRDLFRDLMDRWTKNECAWLSAGKEAGGRSVWLTSYYTGADTISPTDYGDIVLPYERRVCQAAKGLGLYVLYWFLGDLMPILDHMIRLPLDALVLEQGRKGYAVDPVAIRRKVGPNFCIFGFGLENDFCAFNRAGLSRELSRQMQGAGREGAFVVGTPIMPPNARPEAVDYYFSYARQIGR